LRWRFAGTCEAQLDEVLLYSAKEHGLAAALRYQRLFIATVEDLATYPNPTFSRAIARLPGLRTVHIQHANRLVSPEDRVRDPRHLVLYRTAADGTIEVLGILYDRMQLVRAARRALRAAGG
jgi:toxin ParE1/3/4